jgi:Lamin Tail Domain/Bacterial Ig domain/CotH kinase protein
MMKSIMQRRWLSAIALSLVWTALSLVKVQAQSQLIPAGAEWKYLDNGTDQGTAWQDLNFNDTSWASGPAQLGYGDNDEATVISFGPDSGNKYITYYFRRTFVVDDPSDFVSIAGSLTYDDGAVIYLNGVEVFRINLPGGTILFNTLAAGAADYTPEPFTILPSSLVAGTNIIAVEMHQANGTSSDISFDMSLTGDTLPVVILTSPSNGQMFTAPVQITLSANATDGGSAATITSVEFFDGPDRIGATTASPFTFLWNNAIDGVHVLTAVATDDTGNRATSAPATITVTDPNPPQLVSASATTNEVDVIFSKRVTAVSANDITHYGISNGGSPITILSAELSSSMNAVKLTTAYMTPNSTYTLTVNDVVGTGGQTIAPGSQIQFTVQTFTVGDVGNPTIPGSMIPGGSGIDLSGSGTNILGRADQFVFSYVQRADDFDVKVRVEGLSLSDAWAKAGLMARESLANNVRYAGSFATPGISGSSFQSRNAVGGDTTVSGYFPSTYPNTWLRLKRSGDLFNGYASADGQNWAQLGSVTLSGAPRPILVGLAVSSASANQAATGKFREFNDVEGGAVGGVALDREPLGPSSRRGPFVISEIMYHPREVPGFTNNSLEFIEIFNSQAWDEDIGGYRISGAVDYVIPPGTTVKSGGFLVVARDPAFLQTHYAISGVLGPWEGAATNGLPNNKGLVRLRGRASEVLQEVAYEDQPPWPLAADGTGHSIVLARPSLGEGNPAAWKASDAIDGSPGRDDPFGSDPIRNVMINEFLAHTDDPLQDFIELYNHGNQAVDISGAWLSDDPKTNRYQIPAGTVLAPRGFKSFNQTTLGFALNAGGESIFLVNSNQTRVIDAVSFQGQANGVSTGRYPDGAPEIYELSTLTPDGANTAPFLRDIVINEIMYSPISGKNADEYLELYNRGASPVDVSGWRFTSGIDFKIPANTVVPTNGYLVVAKDATNLLAKYTQLNGQNTVGDYNGSLANGGEYIALSRPDQVASTNKAGMLETNTIWIVVDDFTYQNGGRWGWWSAGGGSSLELKDPHSDNRQPANWADSDETAKSTWTTIEGTAATGESLGTAGDRLIIYNPGDIGECLIDDVEVRNFGGPNSITANPGFEDGPNGIQVQTAQTGPAAGKWYLQGSHDHSIISTEAFTGSYSLHLRAASRGDNGPNRIYSPSLSPTATGGAGNPVTLRCKARWLRGWPEVLMLLHGDTMEVGGRLNVPSNLGSPGLPNSVLVNNAGPAIWDVVHNPILPAAGVPVVVTARVIDPDGIGSVQLKYRNDTSSGSTQTVTMTDNGSGGDAIAGDGVYSGTIPGQSGGVTIAFYLQATDGRGAINTFPQDVFPKAPDTRVFPTDAITRELVIRWDDKIIPGSFGNYRLWLTAANTARWSNRYPHLNNAVMDGTFVYNNYRVIYNMKPEYAGSPWHRGQMTSGPDGANRVDFDIEFPTDDRFLGVTDDVWNNPGNPGGNDTSDTSCQSEQTSYLLFKGLNIHYNYRRYIHLFVNGDQRSTRPGNVQFIMEDSQQPNGDTISEWFPDDTGGDLYKIEDEFWFPDDGNEFSGNDDADLGRRNIPGTTDPQISAYRFAFRKRSLNAGESQLNYTTFTRILNTVSPTTDNNAPIPNVDGLNSLADIEEWMRIFAVQHTVGNWDSYGYNRGKNAYMYVPQNGTANQWTWDIDFTMGIGGDGATTALFPTTDPRIAVMWRTSPILRSYWRAFQDIVDGPLNNSYLDPILDAKAEALRKNNVTFDPNAVNTIKNFILARRNYLIGQINAVNGPFAVNGPTSFTSDGNLITLTGTAPVKVKDLLVNGKKVPVTWTSVTDWRVTLVALPGMNSFQITGEDSQGLPVAGVDRTVNVEFTGQSVDPQGALVFSEIMYNPQVPNTSFVEIHNRASNFSFDISGWEINGLNFSFPKGTIITNNQYLVVVKDLGAFVATYGGNGVAGVFDGQLDLDGETLTLLKPGQNGSPDVEIDKVRYEAVAPWATTPNGNGPSLQLSDAAQDNSRVSNWSDGSGWRFFTYTGPAGGTATKLYFWLTNSGEVFLDDIELVQGDAPGTGVNIVQDAGFESGALAAPWSALGNHATSVVSTEYAHSGTHSLHVIATGAGSASSAIVNSGISGIVSTANYTLSFYYLAVSKDGLNYRLTSPFRSFDPIDVTPIQSTPGLPNTSAKLLPAYDPVWLNEVAPNNTTGLTDSAGQHDPWIELYNNGTTPVSLDGYFLADNYTANLTQWAFPAGTTINPGEFKVVWVDGQPAQTAGSELHAGFRLSAGSGSVALVRLVDGAPQITDYLSYSGLSADQGYGDFPDGQPFKRYVFGNLTPGAPNIAKPADVFINEWLASNVSNLVNPASGGFDDWFELYNGGGDSVDLTGYYLTDNINNKTQFQIPAGFVLAPHGFLLVWADNNAAANAGGSGQLHVNFALNKAGEAIGLYSPAGALVDQVNFGGQADDVTQGRLPDGSATIEPVLHPTPAAPNQLGGGPTEPVLDISVSGSDVSIAIPTETGMTYRLLYTDSLTPPVTWIPMPPDIAGTGAPILINDTIQANLQRYYQVLIVAPSP